jgi:hypothetical protein
MNIARFSCLAALFVFGFAIFPNQFGQNEVIALAEAKCRIPTLQEAKNEESAIFEGKILEVTPNENGKTFVLSVNRNWKGAKTKKITIFVNESARFESWFEIGKKYLVFARLDDSKKLVVGRCSRSNEIEQAADDLKSLGKSRKPR